jgi:hypothetical protein
MLKLERDVWEGKLTANLDTTSDVEFRNDSVFHIGTVQIRVTAKLDRFSDDVNISCILLKTIDLPPGQSIRISIARGELPFDIRAKYQNSIDVLTEATILEVTGMPFSQT